MLFVDDEDDEEELAPNTSAAIKTDVEDTPRTLLAAHRTVVVCNGDKAPMEPCGDLSVVAAAIGDVANEG
jgi:hypothetical protein